MCFKLRILFSYKTNKTEAKTTRYCRISNDNIIFLYYRLINHKLKNVLTIIIN